MANSRFEEVRDPYILDHGPSIYASLLFLSRIVIERMQKLHSEEVGRDFGDLSDR